MTTDRVSLGFVEGSFRPGVHVCHVFSSDADRDHAVSAFIATGLRAGERCSCVAPGAGLKVLTDELRAQGLDADAAVAAGSLTKAEPKEVYCPTGTFDPERMLDRLTRLHEQSVASGYPGTRVIGEMTSALEQVLGGSRLLEYEARMTILLRDHPITTVCQCDARQFDGASVMDILRVHPFVVVRGTVVENPFYVPPEEFLKTQGCQP